MKNRNLIIIWFLAISLCAFSQPAQKIVKVSITPNSNDWLYKSGDKVTFDVKVTQNGIPMKDIQVRYELSEDMMPPFKTESAVLKDGQLRISAGTMTKPGFLRCRVFAKHDNKEYEGRATAGFSPELITPTTKMPADFEEFWDKAKASCKKVPLNSRLTLLPERCTDKVNVYELSVQVQEKGSRIYGILCVPKDKGKYPALLRVPGAGVRPYYGDLSNAEKGIITLDIGIHGIPVTLEPKVYEDLRNGALNGYSSYNSDSRDNMYYKRVYLGCVKAIDYISAMPEFDGENLLVYGGSQGGALSIITAALDSRVKGLISFYPALSDMNGYLHNRAGGWPHSFRNIKDPAFLVKQKEETMAYYDVVNFARLLKVPVFYSFGYNDMVCPPTTSYAVYNTIQSPKTLNIVPEIEHYTYPEMWDKAWSWAYNILNIK